MKKKFFFAAVALGTLAVMISCNSNSNEVKNSGKKRIKIKSLNIETVNIDFDGVSYIGYSGVSRDSLYFFDEFYSYFYNISLDGKVGSRRCGVGRGPGEIPAKYLLEAAYLPSQNMLVTLSGSNDLFVVENMATTKRILYKEGVDNGSYAYSQSYTLWPEVVADCDGKYFYYNVTGNDEAVDMTRSDYYDKAALLMRVDINSGEVKPVGNYSKYYAENRDRLKHLPFYYFDVAENGDIYVTHQADPLIYCYDSDFNLKRAFGFDGADMNTEYSDPGSTQESFMSAYEKDIQGAGYYYWVHHVDGYTFRSYKKQGAESQDGLQIFKGETLIGDVEVPASFKVVGYIAPYFVTKIICDEENESAKFYKFKL